MSGKSSAKRAAKQQEALIRAQEVRDRAKLAEEEDVTQRKKVMARSRQAGRGALLKTSPSGVAKTNNLGGSGGTYG